MFSFLFCFALNLGFCAKIMHFDSAKEKSLIRAEYTIIKIGKRREENRSHLVGLSPYCQILLDSHLIWSGEERVVAVTLEEVKRSKKKGLNGRGTMKKSRYRVKTMPRTVGGSSGKPQ